MTIKALLRKLIGRSTQSDVLETSQRLFDAGRVFESIEYLTLENRSKPSANIETRLMDFRHRGFFQMPHPQGLSHWPPAAPTSPFQLGVIPAITKPELTSLVLAQGILGHGSLIVRELLSASQVSTMVEVIDCAYDAFDAGLHDNRSEDQQAWFTPLQPNTGGDQLKVARKWVRSSGGVLAADSPRGFFKMVEILRQSGVLPILADYLGERPALSIKKTTLRRISPMADAGWHQDGAFLGKDIRTVNLWIALTDCGVDAPSMDMVPVRLPEVIPTGAGAAHFSWSVDGDAVQATTKNTPPVRLQFKAGDAILFDELNLHRTAVGPGMTRDRYAIETWFFAPSCYPLDNFPILC